jgi:hemerythrin-like domain-containing protein
MPSGQQAQPVMPSGSTAQPVMPSGRQAKPVMPSGNVAQPVMPSGQQAQPILPSGDTAQPVLPSDPPAQNVLPFGEIAANSEPTQFRQSTENAMPQQNAIEVSAVEDLMREHGVLRRVLLIYEEISSRLESGTPFSADLLAAAANIVRNFVENYHEGLEEQYIFPHLGRAGIMVDVVATLQKQHAQGRLLTDYIITNANDMAMQDPTQCAVMKATLDKFIRMYRPHAAREDTEVFPAFKGTISQEEYDSIGDMFEQQEQESFGENGFQSVVQSLEPIEQALGIYSLGQFTPTVSF